MISVSSMTDTKGLQWVGGNTKMIGPHPDPVIGNLFGKEVHVMITDGNKSGEIIPNDPSEP